MSGLSSLAQSPWEIMKAKLSGYKVAAHQGEIWGLYQNTIKSFEVAQKKGADIVELDLRATRDGVAVVYHDEDLTVFTKCKGKLADYSLAELQKCDFRFTKEKMPTFEDVLKWSQGKMIINAEFKDTASIKPAIDLIQKYQAHSWVYFQTQHSQTKYELARSLDPDVVLLFVVGSEESLEWFLSRQDPALLVAELNKKSLNPEWIEKLHAAGKLVSEDSFNYSKVKELFGATCHKVFQLRMNIAVTNRTSHCKRQALRYQ